jgi:hypothetical protein
MSTEPRKFSAQEMAADGFEVGYYGGYYVDLKIPKGLTREDHSAYAEQKVRFINRLAETYQRMGKNASKAKTKKKRKSS